MSTDFSDPYVGTGESLWPGYARWIMGLDGDPATREDLFGADPDSPSAAEFESPEWRILVDELSAVYDLNEEEAEVMAELLRGWIDRKRQDGLTNDQAEQHLAETLKGLRSGKSREEAERDAYQELFGSTSVVKPRKKPVLGDGSQLLKQALAGNEEERPDAAFDEGPGWEPEAPVDPRSVRELIQRHRRLSPEIAERVARGLSAWRRAHPDIPADVAERHMVIALQAEQLGLSRQDAERRALELLRKTTSVVGTRSITPKKKKKVRGGENKQGSDNDTNRRQQAAVQPSRTLTDPELLLDCPPTKDLDSYTRVAQGALDEVYSSLINDKESRQAELERGAFRLRDPIETRKAASEQRAALRPLIARLAKSAHAEQLATLLGSGRDVDIERGMLGFDSGYDTRRGGGMMFAAESLKSTVRAYVQLKELEMGLWLVGEVELKHTMTAEREKVAKRLTEEADDLRMNFGIRVLLEWKAAGAGELSPAEFRRRICRLKLDLKFAKGLARAGRVAERAIASNENEQGTRDWEGLVPGIGHVLWGASEKIFGEKDPHRAIAESGASLVARHRKPWSNHPQLTDEALAEFDAQLNQDNGFDDLASSIENVDEQYAEARKWADRAFTVAQAASFVTGVGSAGLVARAGLRLATGLGRAVGFTGRLAKAVSLDALSNVVTVISRLGKPLGRRVPFRKKLGRFLFEDRKTFQVGRDFRRRWPRTFGRGGPLGNWSMEHMIRKTRGVRGASPRHGVGSHGHKQLQGKTDAGLNVLPIPHRMNQWLYNHPNVSRMFNYGFYPVAAVGSTYGAFRIGQAIGHRAGGDANTEDRSLPRFPVGPAPDRQRGHNRYDPGRAFLDPRGLSPRFSSNFR